MSAESIKLNFLVTCINSPEIQELHGIKDIYKPEREIALGSYKDDNGKYIYRQMDDNGMYTEDEESYKREFMKPLPNIVRCNELCNGLNLKVVENSCLRISALAMKMKCLKWKLKKPIQFTNVMV